MQEIFKEAAKHKGTSFVEIYQNCNIFNDGTFSAVYERSERADRILRLNHGEVLVFGKDKNKGIRMRGLKPVIVDLDKDFNEKDLLMHDQYCEDSALANLLSGFDYPDFPVPMGIFRQVENSTYGEKIEEQIKSQIEKKGIGNLEKLLRGNHAWTN
jgi:hypothetical protein